MKNFIVKILCFTCLISLCFVLASCSDKTKYDELRDEGNTISVFYNSNCYKKNDGFFKNSEATIIDMFNPDNFTPDENGKIHIKLIDPLSSSRPGATKISISRSGMSLVGWYKERKTTIKEYGGEKYVVDENGDLLQQDVTDDRYYIAYKSSGDYYVKVDEDDKTESEPVYTYSGLWNFDTDTLDYDPSEGKLDFNLYAAWVPYYTFEFYFKEGDTWVKDNTEILFDYISANSGNEYYDELDTIKLPSWSYDSDGAKTGAIEYSFDVKAEKREFPKKDGTTFSAAYLDEACTIPCSTIVKHLGYIDYETGTAVNSVQKIYVVTTEGEDYYIDTAEQLVDNAKLSGVYHIKKDLTFTDSVKWPSLFTYGNFSGKFYSESGSVVTISGISVSNTGNAVCGVFGTLAATSVVKNVNFESVSVTHDVKGNAFKNKTGYLGLFAGLVRKGAKIENVSVGGTLSVGGNCIVKTLGSESNSSVNVYANCYDDDYTLLSGLTKKEVVFKVVGEKDEDTGKYRYLIKTESILVSSDYVVTFETYNISQKLDTLEYTKTISPIS